MAIEHFDGGVAIEYPAGFNGLGDAVAQLRLHPLLSFEGLGKLCGTFLCVVPGLGLWRHGAQGPAQTAARTAFIVVISPSLLTRMTVAFAISNV